MTARPRIDGARLDALLARFAAIGGLPGGGVHRSALSEEDRRARALLAELARTRGFAVSQDPIANLFVRRAGSDPEAAPVLIGSHLDSQPTGGRYDGALGVLAAFACLEALEAAGTVTRRPIEVVAWTNEEGSRFAPGAMGSSAFAAGAIPSVWSDLVDAAGIAFEAERLATLAALPDAPVVALGWPLAAYVELHIEQGPILERRGLPIGAVSGTQGTRWYDIVFDGRPAHAGTTPLDFRSDPMAAAVEALAELYDGVMPLDPEARFTVGRMIAEPGSINAIPGRVALSVDLRHPDAGHLDALEVRVAAACRAAAERRSCVVALDRTLDMPPARFPEAMVETVRAAAAAVGVEALTMPSGAFHDAVFVARVAPTAMIFVPCRDGLSHNEAEYVSPEEIRIGAEVLLAAALDLANRPD